MMENSSGSMVISAEFGPLRLKTGSQHIRFSIEGLSGAPMICAFQSTPGLGRGRRQRSLVRTVRCSAVANTVSIGLVVRKMAPVLGRGVIERQQIRAIYDEAINSAPIFSTVFLAKISSASSAATRCGAIKTSCRAFLMPPRKQLKRVDGLCCQQRCGRALGKTSSSAFQKPRAPSPTGGSGAICSSRRRMSIRSSRRLRAISPTPT